MTAARPLAVILIDKATRSICDKIVITPPDEPALATALQIDLDAVKTGSVRYALEAADLAWLDTALGVKLDADRFHAELGTCHPLDELPYEVHTGRELRLMLAGTKPLAVFADAYPGVDDMRIFPTDVFASHVDAGRIVQREYVDLSAPLPPPVRGIRVLLYALADQAWRIDAYIALRDEAAKHGWSEIFERREGELLGYADWQIDCYLRWLRTHAHDGE